jgi:hypothetical protein
MRGPRHLVNNLFFFSFVHVHAQYQSVHICSRCHEKNVLLLFRDASKHSIVLVNCEDKTFVKLNYKAKKILHRLTWDDSLISSLTRFLLLASARASATSISEICAARELESCDFHVATGRKTAWRNTLSIFSFQKGRLS